MNIHRYLPISRLVAWTVTWFIAGPVRRAVRGTGCGAVRKIEEMKVRYLVLK